MKVILAMFFSAMYGATDTLKSCVGEKDNEQGEVNFNYQHLYHKVKFIEDLKFKAQKMDGCMLGQHGIFISVHDKGLAIKIFFVFK